MMLFKLLLGSICLTAVYGQDCSWITSLDCSTYSYDPVCGSNYVTYASRCEFAKVRCIDPNIDILDTKTCASAGFTSPPVAVTTDAGTQRPAATTMVPNTAGPNTAAPTMGTTHKPVFSGHDLLVDFFCLELSHETCPNDTEPVCGSDGKLYPNFCEFEKHRCSHRDLTPAHFLTC